MVWGGFNDFVPSRDLFTIISITVNIFIRATTVLKLVKLCLFLT